MCLRCRSRLAIRDSTSYCGISLFTNDWCRQGEEKGTALHSSPSAKFEFHQTREGRVGLRRLSLCLLTSASRRDRLGILPYLFGTGPL